MVKTVILIFFIAIVFLIIKTDHYDDCYSDREKEGIAIFGLCGGLHNGTKSTQQEMCINCKYYLPDEKQQENDIL
jgi:hypothetical protein